MVEFRSLIVSLGVVVVGLIAFFGLSDSLNFHYGTDVGSNFNGTQSEIRSLIGSNLSSIADQAGSSVEAREGAEIGEDAQGNLALRALSVITKLPTLMGVVTSAIWEGGLAIGIPNEVLEVALWVFIAVFAITVAYVLVNVAGRIF